MICVHASIGVIPHRVVSAYANCASGFIPCEPGVIRVNYTFARFLPLDSPKSSLLMTHQAWFMFMHGIGVIPRRAVSTHSPGFIQHVSSVVIRVSDISGMIHAHAWHRCHPSRCSHLARSDQMQIIICFQMFVSHYFKHWFMQKIITRPVSVEKRCKL